MWPIIYLLYFPFKSLQFGGIKNEGLEVVENPPNPSPSFFKKLSNMVIELLSLPLLYPPPFLNIQTGHKNTLMKSIILFSLSLLSSKSTPTSTSTKLDLENEISQLRNIIRHCFITQVRFPNKTVSNHIISKTKVLKGWGIYLKFVVDKHNKQNLNINFWV